MFLNFMLDLDAQKYVGVDVTTLFPEEMSANQRVLLIHCYRCAMGLKPSPKHTTQEVMFSELFFVGKYSTNEQSFPILKCLS